MVSSDESYSDDIEDPIDLDSIPSWKDEGDTPLEASQSDAKPDAQSDLDDTGLSQALEERDTYMDSLRRLQADFENYKKRVVRDQEDYAELKNVRLVEELLPVIDAFNLAFSAAHEEDADVEKIKKGIEIVAGELFGVLEKQGLEKINAQGAAFDPLLHDAVMHEEVGEHEEEVVTEVLREGYKVKGKVIRPAMVKVAK